MSVFSRPAAREFLRYALAGVNAITAAVLTHRYLSVPCNIVHGYVVDLPASILVGTASASAAALSLHLTSGPSSPEVSKASSIRKVRAHADCLVRGPRVQEVLDACRWTHLMREELAKPAVFRGEFLPVNDEYRAFVAVRGGIAHAEILPCDDELDAWNIYINPRDRSVFLYINGRCVREIQFPSIAGIPDDLSEHDPLSITGVRRPSQTVSVSSAEIARGDTNSSMGTLIASAPVQGAEGVYPQVASGTH